MITRRTAMGLIFAAWYGSHFSINQYAAQTPAPPDPASVADFVEMTGTANIAIIQEPKDMAFEFAKSIETLKVSWRDEAVEIKIQEIMNALKYG